MIEISSFTPDWVSPLGDTISDILKKREISLPEFAEQIGQTIEDASGIISGRCQITPVIARKIHLNLGGSEKFWLARENQYRCEVARLGQKNSSEDCKEWLNEIPVSDMVKFGWISAGRSRQERQEACLEFFGVSSVPAWRQTYNGILSAVAFRTSTAHSSHPGAVAAWIRKGELETRSLQCGSWDPEAFRDALKKIRALTRQSNPKIFVPELQRSCAEFGVAVAIVRAPTGCRASGATLFIAEERALLLLSFRYKTDDHFWFTFFHEAGHLLLHHQQSLFLEATESLSNSDEDEANEFAANMLVPLELQDKLEALGSDYKKVMRFARHIGVSPGIIAGQLQHRGIVRRDQLNFLKKRFLWTSN